LEGHGAMKTKRGISLILTVVGLMAGSLCSAEILYVDDDAAFGGDGRSWRTAYRFLQDALTEAAMSAKPVELRIAQGVYRPDQNVEGVLPDRDMTFVMLNNVTLSGGYAGLAAIDPNVRDVEQFPTILSGDLKSDDGPDSDSRSDNCYTVVTSMANDTSAVLDGLVITGGSGARGSGLSCYGSAPKIVDCTFTDNIAFGYNWHSDSDEGDGGAVYNLGGSPVFERCRFENNRADSDGGAIWSCDYAELTLSQCTFAGNIARGRGGAVGGSLCDVEARDCTFDKNYTESSGGALYIYKGRQTLDQCHFLNNSAAYGGGIYNIVGNLSITRCVFTGNHADYEGGGLYDDAPHPVCVAATLFAGNRALSMGGGLFCWCDSDPNVTNCTFADNRAPRGSAVAAGLPVLKNCICWDQRTEGSPIHQLGDGPTISYSCIQGGWAGQGNLADDPCFARPGLWSDINNTPEDPNDDLWIDGDYHLMSQVGRWDPNGGAWVSDAADSPCIDAGDPEDLVGCEPLPHGDRINLGAYGGTSEAGKSYHGTAYYEFVSDGSTLRQTGGFAGVDWTYRIEGSFGLTVDMETGTAEFVDVEATATDVDNAGRTVDFETGLVLTSLVGTIQDDGSIAFTGTATDGSALDVQCVLSGDTAELTGRTTPPPNSADFFVFSLNASAVRQCSLGAEPCSL